MAKLVIDLTGRGGLAPKHQGDMNDVAPAPQFRYLGGANQMASGIYNSLRTYGYLSPASNAFVSITENDGTYDFADQMRAAIYDSTTQDYIFGDNGGHIWFGDDPTDRVLSHGVLVTGTSPKITDLEIYQRNGDRRLFYAYQNNAGTNVGIANIPFTSSSDTYLSGTVTNAFSTTAITDAFMIVADNGYMYIIMGTTVHKLDGTTAGGANGTVYANVITFPSDFNIYDGLDARGSIFLSVQTATSIGAANTSVYNERLTGVYIWDRQSTIVRTRDFIQMPGVKEIRKLYLSPKGDIRAIVISSERFVQVRRFNGTTFEVIAELGPLAYPQYRDSVTNHGGLTIWLAADGYFYGHGSIMAGEPEAVYKLGDATSLLTGSFTSGAILAIDDNATASTSRVGIAWSGKTSTPNTYNRIWYPHGQGTINSTAMTGNQGDVYTLVKYLPKLSTINHINIQCFPSVLSDSTTAATIKIYFNQSTTAFKSYTVTNLLQSKGYLNLPIGKTNVNSVQIEIEFSTSQTLGTSDFRPSYVEVDYTPEPDFK